MLSRLFGAHVRRAGAAAVLYRAPSTVLRTAAVVTARPTATAAAAPAVAVPRRAFATAGREVVVDADATSETVASAGAVVSGTVAQRKAAAAAASAVPVSPVLTKWATASDGDAELMQRIKAIVDAAAVGGVTSDSLFSDFTLKTRLLSTVMSEFAIDIASKDLGSIRSIPELVAFVRRSVKSQYDAGVARTAVAAPLPPNVKMLDYRSDVHGRPARTPKRVKWWVKSQTPHLQWTQ